MAFLAVAAPYLAAAGAGIGAVGAISQGEAEGAQAKYQAQVAANNEIIANQYRANATRTGETQAYNQGLTNRQKMGQLVAAQAGSGFDVNTGSAAEVRQGEQQAGYTDVETVRQQAALKAYGYSVEGANYGAQSALDTQESQFAPEAGFLKGGGLMLSGLSTVSPKFAGLFQSANTGPYAYSGDYTPIEPQYGF